MSLAVSSHKPWPFRPESDFCHGAFVKYLAIAAGFSEGDRRTDFVQSPRILLGSQSIGLFLHVSAAGHWSFIKRAGKARRATGSFHIFKLTELYYVFLRVPSLTGRNVAACVFAHRSLNRLGSASSYRRGVRIRARQRLAAGISRRSRAETNFAQRR